MLLQSVARQDAAARLAEEMSAVLLNGSMAVAQQAKDALEKVMVGVYELQATADQQMRRQVDFVVASREAERQAMQEEVN